MNLITLITKTEEELKHCGLWLEQNKARFEKDKDRIGAQEKETASYKKLLTELRTLAEQKEEVCKPNLGCATTRELLDEIEARIEIDGKLDYKTIDNN